MDRVKAQWIVVRDGELLYGKAETNERVYASLAWLFPSQAEAEQALEGWGEQGTVQQLPFALTLCEVNGEWYAPINPTMFE
jgi:hypothetical protein